MLTIHPERHYFVYPSWAELDCKWDELPTLFADPLGSRFNDQQYTAEWAVKHGYSLTIQPFFLVPGPFGNGIIEVHRRFGPGSPGWLPFIVLSDGGAHFDGYPFAKKLIPRDDPAAAFGVVKKPKVYELFSPYEHCEAAGDDVYWLVFHQAGKRPLKGLDELHEWARHFDLEVERLAEPPPALAEETKPLFLRRSVTTEYTPAGAWYRVSSPVQELGYHLARMDYLGLHLRKVAGRRLKEMYLFAQIEGRPRLYLPPLPTLTSGDAAPTLAEPS